MWSSPKYELFNQVWRLWNNEAHLDLIDPAIRENYEKDEVIRSIHIGLLCVQETPAHRPEMSTIFQMLTNSSTVLPMPRAPGCFLRNRSNLDPLTYGSEPDHSRYNSVSYSIVTPRWNSCLFSPYMTIVCIIPKNLWVIFLTAQASPVLNPVCKDFLRYKWFCMCWILQLSQLARYVHTTYIIVNFNLLKKNS